MTSFVELFTYNELREALNKSLFRLINCVMMYQHEISLKPYEIDYKVDWQKGREIGNDTVIITLPVPSYNPKIGERQMLVNLETAGKYNTEILYKVYVGLIRYNKSCMQPDVYATYHSHYNKLFSEKELIDKTLEILKYKPIKVN